MYIVYLQLKAYLLEIIVVLENNFKLFEFYIYLTHVNNYFTYFTWCKQLKNARLDFFSCLLSLGKVIILTFSNIFNSLHQLCKFQHTTTVFISKGIVIKTYVLLCFR